MSIRIHDGRLDRGALGRAVLNRCPYALLPTEARDLLTFDQALWPWSITPKHRELTDVNRNLGSP